MCLLTKTDDHSNPLNHIEPVWQPDGLLSDDLVLNRSVLFEEITWAEERVTRNVARASEFNEERQAFNSKRFPVCR